MPRKEKKQELKVLVQYLLMYAVWIMYQIRIVVSLIFSI